MDDPVKGEGRMITDASGVTRRGRRDFGNVEQYISRT